MRGAAVKGYCSVQDAAKRRDISARRANQYTGGMEGFPANSGRRAESRAMPEDATRPEKRRVRSGPKETAERSGRKDKTDEHFMCIIFCTGVR